MRFCQTDGTPLVADEPLDPYKTMVARPGDLAETPAPPPIPVDHTSEPPEDQLLELPSEADSKKTTFTTEEEIRREMAARDAGEVIEIPPLAGQEPATPAEPSLNPPSFGDLSSPPPSPFSPPKAPSEPPFKASTPPIPSPFSDNRNEPSSVSEPTSKPFAEPEPTAPSINPFETPSAGQSAATIVQSEPAAAAPQAEWQPPAVGGEQFTPPQSAGGVNQTLPIVSLVFGIISLCCYISPVTGLVALITGFKGMKNAKNDPAHYGGRGLAIAGMALGGLFFLLGLIYWIYVIFVIGLSAMGSFGGFR